MNRIHIVTGFFGLACVLFLSATVTDGWVTAKKGGIRMGVGLRHIKACARNRCEKELLPPGKPRLVGKAGFILGLFTSFFAGLAAVLIVWKRGNLKNNKLILAAKIFSAITSFLFIAGGIGMYVLYQVKNKGPGFSLGYSYFLAQIGMVLAYLGVFIPLGGLKTSTETKEA